jgi:hypothetical protein
MELVELNPLRSALVGMPGRSGLSVEQRKRLTIAVELVANPSIIFMCALQPPICLSPHSLLCPPCPSQGGTPHAFHIYSLMACVAPKDYNVHL